MPRCLIVDDDIQLGATVREYLARFGFESELAADGAAMRRHLVRSTFDIVVLDLMLPGENGIELCKWLRAQGRVAIVMLTAMGDPASRVLGLEVGADDYLPKPFEPRELVARLHAVLRRTRVAAAQDRQAASHRLRFAGWVFDRLQRQLVSPDQVVLPLSGAEFRLLEAFVQQPGRVLCRDRLIELTAAPGVEVSGRSIDLAVSRLRGKLGDTGLIRTVRGAGYQFTPVVES
ncbi:MAG TPA: response regulator transcription factor [Rubrivivax sp.]|jgi:two-component system OmpR family response regulator|nr:response regulator transcription factor [Rubrivivax sp.]